MCEAYPSVCSCLNVHKLLTLHGTQVSLARCNRVALSRVRAEFHGHAGLFDVTPGSAGSVPVMLASPLLLQHYCCHSCRWFKSHWQHRPFNMMTSFVPVSFTLLFYGAAQHACMHAASAGRGHKRMFTAQAVQMHGLGSAQQANRVRP